MIVYCCFVLCIVSNWISRSTFFTKREMASGVNSINQSITGQYSHFGQYAQNTSFSGNYTTSWTDFTSDNQTDEWLHLATMAYNINRYYLWAVFALGFPGNLATIITIIKMGPIRTPSLYVLVLAGTDDLAITIKLLYFQLMLHQVPLGDGGCKFLKFFGSFLVAFSNWILIFLAVERFLAIHYPFSRTTTSRCRMRKAIMCMALAAFVLFWIFLHLLWTHSFIEDDVSGAVGCGERQEYQEFVQNIWYWIDSAVYAGMPCVLLFGFNILIIRDIRHSLTTHIALTNNNGCRSGHMFHFQITAMLLTTSIVFVLLTLPICVYFVLDSHWTVQPYTVAEGNKILFKQIAYLLSDFNHAVNFYLYFLSARKFRRHFLRFMRCRCSNKRIPMRMNTIRSNPLDYI